MNQVKWYQKLGSAKAPMLFTMLLPTCNGVQWLGVHWWHNEVVVWIPSIVLLATMLVFLIAWVRRVRES